jgi:hypothetical protein
MDRANKSTAMLDRYVNTPKIAADGMRGRVPSRLAVSTNGVIEPGGPHLVDPLVRITLTEWKR